MQNQSSDHLSHQPSEPQPTPAQDALSRPDAAGTATDPSQADTVRALAEHVLKKLCERHPPPAN